MEFICVVVALKNIKLSLGQSEQRFTLQRHILQSLKGKILRLQIFAVLKRNTCRVDDSRSIPRINIKSPVKIFLGRLQLPVEQVGDSFAGVSLLDLRAMCIDDG